MFSSSPDSRLVVATSRFFYITSVNASKCVLAVFYSFFTLIQKTDKHSSALMLCPVETQTSALLNTIMTEI